MDLADDRVCPGCVKTPESQKRGEWISQISRLTPAQKLSLL
jgi:hypothetical protein